MVKRKIVWTRLAKKRLYGILESAVLRDKDKIFAVSFWKMVLEEIKTLSRNPESGITTSISGIKAIRVDKYIMLYELSDNRIYVHSISFC
jgi:plasmid stabilization system protein ParE